MTACTCPDLVTVMRANLEDITLAPCELHDTPPPDGHQAVALNDTAGLTAIIARALSAPLNTTNPTQPLDAA